MILGSIDKAMKVFEILIENPGGLRLREISEKLDMNQSSVHHILSTMMPYGYIQQNTDTKKYALGFKFLMVASVMKDNMELRDITHKYIDELSCKVNGAVHVSVLKNNKLVYIDKSDRVEGLKLATYIGFTTEPYAAAGGKVLLSQMDEQSLDRMFANVIFKPYTEKTVRNLTELKKELQDVRQKGYALDDEEYYSGIRCISVPIKAGHKIIAALSITSSIFAYSAQEVTENIRKMAQKTADRISLNLL